MSTLLNARAGGARLALTTGNWVDGDRFIGREADIARLRGLIDRGDNGLISAMRRVGKTSLMRETLRRMGADRRCIFLDVEHCGTLTDAIAQLAAETRDHQKTFDRVVESFRDFAGAARKLQVADLSVEFRDRIGAAWREKGDRILAAIAEAAGPPAVICIDELPILLSRILRDANDEPTPAGKATVEHFMQWLRAARERHRGRLSFVFAGSIGLAPLLRAAGLSATINNLTDLGLEPWTPDDALLAWAALAQEYDLEVELAAGEEMVRRLGVCIPRHVQLLFAAVREGALHTGHHHIGVGEVAAAYTTQMLRPQGNHDLHHMEERLRLSFRRVLQRAARDILTQAALADVLGWSQAAELVGRRVPDPDERDEATRDILNTLVHDGYLRHEATEYRFASRLLRDFWVIQFGPGFEPAAALPGVSR